MPWQLAVEVFEGKFESILLLLPLFFLLFFFFDLVFECHLILGLLYLPYVHPMVVGLEHEDSLARGFRREVVVWELEKVGNQVHLTGQV